MSIVSFAAVNEINLKTCQVMFFPDFRHCLFYNKNSLVIVNIQTKSITFKVSYPNETISKIKIIDSFRISYVRRCKGHSQIIFTNLNCLDEYYESKTKEEIIDYYHFFLTEDQLNYLLLITKDFELILFKENLEQYRESIEVNNNFFFDQFESPIIKIEFIKEVSTFVIIFSNGMVRSFRLVKIEGSHKLKFESNDMTFLSSEDLNANEKYEIVNFHKKTIECRELHDSNSDNKSFERGTYLTVVSKKNGIHSLISIFIIDKLGSLNLLQRINVKNRIILDSYLCNRNKTMDKIGVPDYLFILVQEEKQLTIFKIDFYSMIGLHEQKEVNNSVQFCKFLQIDTKNTVKICFYGVNFPIIQINKNNNDNISVSEESLFNYDENDDIIFNFIILRILNELECDFSEHIIEKEPKSKEKDKLFKDGLTYNVSKFMDFYLNNKMNVSLLEEFNLKIQEIISKNPFFIQDGIKFFQCDNYLLFLIQANQFFSIKKYIGIRDYNDYNKFVVSNDILSDTCQFLLENIKKHLISNQFDLSKTENAFPYLICVLEIMKTVKNRNSNPNRKPFENEEKIIAESIIKIDNLIYEIEILIFILKILKLSNLQEYGNLPSPSYFDVFSVIAQNELIQKNDFISRLSFLYNTFQIKDDTVNMLPMLYFAKFLVYLQFSYLVNYSSIISNCIDIKKEKKEYELISCAIKNMDSNNFLCDTKPIFEFLEFLSSSLYPFQNKINKNPLIEKLSRLRLNFMEKLIEDQHYQEGYTIGRGLIKYMTNSEEWKLYLNLLLKMRLINIAYEYLGTCFCIYYFSLTNTSIETIIGSPQYLKIKELYHLFFEDLIINEKIEILLSFPFNFIEKYLFKEFLLENKKYEDLLILYYLKLKNVIQAEDNYQKSINSTVIRINDTSTKLYQNIIDNLKMLFEGGKKTEESALYVQNSIENKKRTPKHPGILNNISLIKEGLEASLIDDNLMFSNKKKEDTLEKIKEIMMKIKESSFQTGKLDYNYYLK